MPFANDCLDVARVPVNALSVLRTLQCSCDELRLVIKDQHTGEVCDLTQYGIGPEASSSSSSSSSSESCCCVPAWCMPRNEFTGVQIVTKALPNDSALPINIAATIKTEEDAKNGVVYLQLTPQDTDKPGIWGAMAIIRQCGVSRKALPFFLEIQPSLEQINSMSGPLTIYEVRLSVRDLDPTLNFLIDSVDYQEVEIAFMIRKAIDIWNETQPHTVARYTMNDFPFRYHWIEATVGQLMIMVADHMRRNDLDYNAAGVSIEDTKKWPYYLKEGQNRINEFKAWAIQTKLAINIEGGFGSVGGYRQIIQR
jgi:hypothetical protein